MIGWLTCLSYLLTGLPAHALIALDRILTRPGSPIDNASELVMCFGGVASEGLVGGWNIFGRLLSKDRN